MSQQHAVSASAQVLPSINPQGYVAQDTPPENGYVFTILTAYNTTLAKDISLDDHGGLRKRASAQMTDGRYEVCEVADLNGLLHVLDTLQSTQCVTWGVPKGARVGDTGDVCTQGNEQARERGAIPRDREHFEWPAGRGILMLDHDGMPDRKVSINEFQDIMVQAVPSLAGAHLLGRPSGSAGIERTDGTVLSGLHKHRTLVAVDDARLNTELGQAIEAALWAAGHGWCEVSKSGQRLKRCAVDTAVWQPERIDFAAPPTLGDGLVRPAVAGQVWGSPARAVRAADVIASVDSKVRDAADAAWKEAREAKAAEARLVAEAWAITHGKELATKRCISEDQAVQVLQRAATGRVLMGDFILRTSDGKYVTVGEVLDDPKRWHGARFYDPLEPDHDNRVASINLYGRRTLHTHKHGGLVFQLKRQVAKIILTDGNRPEAVDQAVEVLKDTGGLYVRADKLTSMAGDGTLFPLEKHESLADHLGRVCSFHVLRRRGKDIVEEATYCPDWLAKTIMAKGPASGLPLLEGVSTAPVLRLDGSVFDLPGYDEVTRMEYVHKGGDLVRVPVNPTPADAIKAMRYLIQPLSKFPFVDCVSRGVAYAGVLTAAVRASLPTAPGFGFDAPTAGSGKSLLGKVLAALCSGEAHAFPMPQTTHEDETRKRIFASMLSGQRVLFFDNLNKTWGDAALDMFLTSPNMNDRLLGRSTDVSVSTRALVIGTGNNLTLGADTYRRVLICRIDPRVENPGERQFEFCPHKWTVANRNRMVAAALTVIRAHIVAGAPRVAQFGVASFEDWDRLVRQPLMWVAGLMEQQDDPQTTLWSDPADSIRKAKADNGELDCLANVLEHWHRLFGSKEIKIKDLMTAAGMGAGPSSFPQSGDAWLREALEAAVFPKAANPQQLGYFAKRNADRIVRGHCLEKVGSGGNSGVWRVTLMEH